jgi:hypothetical protein
MPMQSVCRGIEVETRYIASVRAALDKRRKASDGNN